MRVLAADVGATNARFAIAEVGAEGVRLRFERAYASASQPGFEAALRVFLGELSAARRPDRARDRNAPAE